MIKFTSVAGTSFAQLCAQEAVGCAIHAGVGISHATNFRPR